VGFVNSTFAISCCFVFSLLACLARGQTASQVATPEKVRATAISGQEFHCHTGYSLAQCQKDILHLKSVLSRYPIEGLGHWTWILVRSQDWKPISRILGLNPDSPAFTAIEPRETFLDEALFAHDPERTSELMTEFGRSMPQLLEIAVSHELGHAFCGEPNETAADRFAAQLRSGLAPPCRVSKQARKQSLATRAPREVEPHTLRAP
jgi:hypothetical protein